MQVIRIMLLSQLLMVPLCARAADVYHIRPLSERQMLRIYTSVMRDACRHSNGEWHEMPSDPGAGYWGDGISEGNEGIRAISITVLTCAALLKYSDALTSAERRDYLAKSTAAIRFAVWAHVTGTGKCTDGKQWGGSWQSGMWTGTLAFGAWLIWDDLASELREGVERVVTSEADRFLAGHPPSGRWGDTKAEENAWDSLSISAAANMFPSHPHAAAWREKAIEYMMNTLSVPRDLKDKSLVDGRAVSEWVRGVNLNPDFTLENHDFFHPSYVACSSYMLGQAVMYYTYAGRRVPAAATHHLMDTWRMFQTILLPWGEAAFPQGMDWELHGLPIINLQAFMATYMHDPAAAGMEQASLQYMRAWQEWAGGDMTVPGSSLGFTRHAICAEQVAWSYLSHKLFGPTPPSPPLSKGGKHPAPLGKGGKHPPTLDKGGFVRRYSSVDVILHRTESKLASFSWKNRIMGMLVPVGEGHAGNPFFTFPITNGLVGSIELSPAGDTKTSVLERAWRKTSKGFETTGVLVTNGRQLKQTLRVASIGAKTVVYQDRVTALSDVSVTREMGVPIGIENDQISGGKRVVYHRDGRIVFDWQKPQPTVAIPGPWVNVDGRLGVVTAAGSGLAYSQATAYNPQAVYADVLYGSFSNAAESLAAGDEVARRIVLLCVEITPEETSALSRSVRIEDRPDGQVLHFALPEGGEAEVSLL